MKNKINILLLIALCAIIGCDQNKTYLHIYSWSDYISPDVIASFEEKYNCNVIVDSFDSNEAMYAKLKAGSIGYDILLPSSYQVDLLVKENMIEKMDHSLIPNVKNNFDLRYMSQILDTNMTYGVPYVVTYTGFLYLKDKVEDIDIGSWGVLTNQNLRGKITLLDDIREVIGAGLMYNGYSINSEKSYEIDEAVATILEWKKNIRKFDAESYRTEVPSHMSFIGHGYSSDSSQVIFNEDGTVRNDIAFILPREGFTIAFDEFAIMKDSKNKYLAYQFIDFLYEEYNALENMKYVCGIMPHKNAIEKLPDEMKAFFIPSDKTMSKGQVLKSFIEKPSVQELYNKAWDKIKAIEK